MTPSSFAPGPLRGDIVVPGDKSISHRALFVAARSTLPVAIGNLNAGADVRATVDTLGMLGVRIVETGTGITVAAETLRSPGRTLNCMNSGSTARMLLGLCAGAALEAQLDGDASLQLRPMEPVAAQIRAFGARIQTTGGTLPASVTGSREVQTRKFILIAPSAQVKTAILLAGLFARVAVTVLGDKGSRDHTERLLKYLGADITFDRSSVVLRAAPDIGGTIEIPGDFSAAAFFLVAATICPGSSIRLRGVGVNPTRTGLLDILTQMGSNIALENEREICGEPVADIVAQYAPLRGIAIGADLALRAIDEIQAVAVAAAFASGETRITGVKELRVKESDRIAAIERMLSAVGITADALPDGITIRGGTPAAGTVTVNTQDDHRTVMASAALAAGAGTLRVDSAQSAEVSFPGFARAWSAAQGSVS